MNDLTKMAPALVALQAELTVVDKSADNPFFKSSYAPLPEVRKAMQPLLARHGLALITMPTVIRDVRVGELRSPVTEPTNGLHWYLIHESGQFLEGEWMLTPKDHTPQGEGSDVTYKRRYAEMAITGLVADEDDDGNAASAPPPAPKKKKTRPASPGEAVAVAIEDAKDDLRVAIEQSGADPEDFAWVAEAKTKADLDQIRGAIEALKMGTAVAS